MGNGLGTLDVNNDETGLILRIDPLAGLAKT